MKYLLTLFFLFFLSGTTFSQIITDKSNYNFGEVRKEDKKFVDFKLTNASKNVIRILRTEEPYGTSVRFSSKSIPPDSSIVVRIKYTPKRKGDFSADVPIWVSSNNQPIVLSIKGEAITFDSKESLESPDFEKNISNEKESELLTIKVLESGTKKPIENAKVDIVWDGVIYKSFKSNPNGVISKSLKDDTYYIIASAEGYGTAETDIEFNADKRELIIELGENTGEIIAVVPPVETEPEVTKTDTTAVTTGQALQDEPPRKDTVAIAINEPVAPIQDSLPKPVPDPEPEPEKIVITSPDLPEDKYAPNNIVFLIDVSVSMKQGGKLDLLKASMIELTNLLRSSDKVAIVTYSSTTKLMLASTSASDKETIIEVIKNLKASGNTAGTRGVKKAYLVLDRNHMDNGNNQIFISTDGAFNLEKKDKKLPKIVKRNAKKGNKISVLGIKNKKWTVKNMKEIAKNGKGNYIHIENYENAKSSLVEEVRKQSIKK